MNTGRSRYTKHSPPITPPQAGHDAPWVLYRLEDNQDTNANVNERREEYKPVRVSESEIDIR